MPSSTPQTPTIKISPPDSDLPSTPAPATAPATATPSPPPPHPPSRPPNHHSDSDISVLDLGPSMDTFHPTEPPPTHTQQQLQQQPTLAPPTPLAVLPGTDALTIITTVPSTVPGTTTTIANIDGETHASDDEESGSATPRPSAISFTTTTSTSGSGQATPVPRRGRVLGSRGVLASLRAFSSPLLMPLRGDVSSSSSSSSHSSHSSSAAAASASGSGSGSEIGSGDGSGRRVRGARPGVRRARTSLWGR